VYPRPPPKWEVTGGKRFRRFRAGQILDPKILWVFLRIVCAFLGVNLSAALRAATKFANLGRPTPQEGDEVPLTPLGIKGGGRFEPPPPAFAPIKPSPPAASPSSARARDPGGDAAGPRRRGDRRQRAAAAVRGGGRLPQQLRLQRRPPRRRPRPGPGPQRPSLMRWGPSGVSLPGHVPRPAQPRVSHLKDR